MLKVLRQTVMTWAVVALVAVFAVGIGDRTARGQNVTTLLPNAVQQYFDKNGNPLSYGKIYYYIPGTNTKKNTWQDVDRTQFNTNPIILNEGGWPPATPTGSSGTYGTGSYRQVVTDASDNVVWDRITASTDGGGNITTVGDGDLVGTIKPWGGMIAPNQYMFAAGQAIARTDYPDLLTAITILSNVVCTAGSPTLTGVADTTQIGPGAKVESQCLPPGATVVSTTSTTVTLDTNAAVTAATQARFYPWGNGNQSTTFNLPDLRGRVLAGRDNMNGAVAGVLTSEFYGTNPDAIGTKGGGQSIALLLSNMAAINSTVNIPAGQGSHTHGTNANSTASFVGSAPGGGNNFVTPSGAVINNATLPAMSGTAASNNTGGVAVSATVNAGGSGYTNGTILLTVSGGTCTTQPQFNVTVTGGVVSAPVLATAGKCSVAPTNPAATTTGGSGTGATLNITYSATPFSVIQPTVVLNYIIKVVPDTSSVVASGVASIGGMTGVIACGTGLTCTGNIISTVTATAAGANGQVQFNNASLLGASPDFTWVSPQLGLGSTGGNTGQLALFGATSGSLIQTVPAIAGTPTVTWGSSSGTPAVVATGPLVLNTTTGGVSCPTCATTSGGGSLTASAPLSITGNNLAITTGNLTKTDDTNVTMTLGGTPTGALINGVSITMGWAGTLSVSRGGTGLSSGTSGGVPYFSASGTMASSGALGANQIVLGGGAGAAPTSLSCPTGTTLLHGGTPPTCVQLAYADIASGTLAAASDYAAATASKLVPASVIYPTETTTTYGTTITLDFATFINTAVTLTGNITTMNVSNAMAGKGGTIRFIQSGAGSFTTVFNSVFKFAGGTVPALTTGSATAVDVLTYYCQTTTFCTASLAKDVK